MPPLRRFALPGFFTLMLVLPLLLLPLLVILPSGPALADAIDGHWCHDDGRLMSIAGPRIVTPKGTETSGDYRRHFFTYQVPASEPAPGTVVSMTQLNEQQIHVRRGADQTAAEAATPEPWHRCAAAVS